MNSWVMLFLSLILIAHALPRIVRQPQVKQNIFFLILKLKYLTYAVPIIIIFYWGDYEISLLTPKKYLFLTNIRHIILNYWGPTTKWTNGEYKACETPFRNHVRYIRRHILEICILSQRNVYLWKCTIMYSIIRLGAGFLIFTMEFYICEMDIPSLRIKGNDTGCCK